MNRWYIAMKDVTVRDRGTVHLRVVPGTSAEGPMIARLLLEDGWTLVLESKREVDLRMLAPLVAEGSSIVQWLGDDCVQVYRMDDDKQGEARG